MAIAMLTNIERKLSKESYRPLFLRYGRGYLLCCARDPLFDAGTLSRIHAMLAERAASIHEVNKGFFKEVYLYERASSFTKLCHFTT